ncbi:response regulator transcription factor [Chloroflexota bacterium]
MKVLVIEDSPDVVEALALCFELRWPEAEVLFTDEGSKGISLAKTESLDVVILDLGLPDMDGFEVLREIRSFSNVSIAILTVRSDEFDKVRGLELGADDYITKPFSHLEFLARVQSLLRRNRLVENENREKVFRTPRLVIDFVKRTVDVNGQPVKLTPTEYNLLYYLVLNANNILTHRALLEKVWGEEYIDSPEYLKVYVQRLRNKLEETPSSPQLIISERGIGYKFVGPK